MRPIKLKIKGLNSFIDSQDVNFEKLTDKGLFGIFGPTGSGKSTILDGITLALYGEVARKSSNYMNTNCDTLNVSFQFQISSKEIKRYRVDREFKRDHKTGSIRSKSAKIIDITEENEIILEEGAKTVTGKCEEIIGLKLEDFTRTVVLPQGKFSEFLKLEGKDRRNMLERLFNLQKYGDNLSIKLNNNTKEEKEKASILEGELKGYEDISDKILEEKTKDLSVKKEQCDKCEIELKSSEEALNKGKELWDIQNELKEQLHRENKLKEKAGEIDESQRKVALGESALKVKPYIDNYENALVQIKAVDSELVNLKNKVEAIKENKAKLESLLETAKNKKDKELPLLNVKEQKVADAIEEKNILDAIKQEKNLLEKKIINTEENLRNTNDRIEKNEVDINEGNTNITIKEDRVETLKISEEYKEKVNEGIVILNSYRNLVKQKNNLSVNIKTTLANAEKAQNKSEKLLKELEHREKILISYNEELKQLVEACPGDQNTLLILQEKLSSLRDKWNKFREYSAYISKSKETIEKFKEELNSKKEEKVFLEKEINEINNSIKKLETENLAHILRESLLEGEPCPVCGSKDHHKAGIKILDSSNLGQLKIDLSSGEEKYKLLTEGTIKLETTIKGEERNIKERELKISELGEDFKAASVDILENEFDRLKDNINIFNTKKTDLDKKIKALSEEKSTLSIEYGKENTRLIENRGQSGKLQEDLKLIDGELQKTNEKLSALKLELAIEDFENKSQEIFRKEKEKAALEKEIKVLRDSLKDKLLQKEAFSKALGILREDLRGKKTTLIEKDKNIEEKEKSIKNKVGAVEDLHSLMEEIAQYIKEIKEGYERAEKAKNEIEIQYNQCNSDIISTQSKLSSLKERSINDGAELESALLEEGIENIDEAKNNFIIKEEINKLKLEIEKYKDSLAKLTGTIESLKEKMNNRSLTEEQWIEIQNVKNEKAQILKDLEENKIKLETEVKAIGERLEEKKKLLKNKEKLDYKLGLLDDLDKLFKGKKFVEFVAANQLKYVSIEACKRLKEITGGNYGLEVDENGKFLIRDYKNGGAQRDVSTLSGGETFVTSLALALALSAQIQLKGTAPLELFFLDEGFGTLDDNLLEVVMDSLEKIHNDKLSIGIISHVESIKNRVPVKLIVTAAEAGMGGSKVRIERS
ncbi:SbcC/MukB-like Walker B domain-containing protein [Clostridium pasteurianum]|uniref:Nuclease SbcCD subunit C n=1 Tax=Clostridium pasteurianum BC1 TaxID=86416 RepID=R4K7B1_CLOPA|nr:SbcC/MukB-like Walker B domain-containing protein [Clostridium pasteurianum]AGK98458.1 ATPase involved in DNA repair [Clostridium pasteurianum BC1]